MPGTLYLLRSHADASLHKIGITNHWHQRAKQLEECLHESAGNLCRTISLRDSPGVH
jgi:Ni2+-binding GTPase involved in maturation of urease and hydrogenase